MTSGEKSTIMVTTLEDRYCVARSKGTEQQIKYLIVICRIRLTQGIFSDILTTQEDERGCLCPTSPNGDERSF